MNLELKNKGLPPRGMIKSSERAMRAAEAIEGRSLVIKIKRRKVAT